MSERAVIYTAITGGYDELHPVPEQAGVDCEYVAFTDVALPDAGWDIRQLRGFGAMEPRMLSRLPKSLPHRFFDYRTVRYAIWVDGSVNLQSRAFASDVIVALQGHPLACFPHPKRDCIYDEAVICQPLKKYQAFDLLGQVDAYRTEGYPEHYGLPACTVMVWDLAHPQQPELGERWWAEQERYGTMDQLALPVVLWRMDLGWGRIPGHLWRNRWYYITPHGGAQDELRLNLGCADHILPNWVNVDLAPGPGVTVVDLRERWPWADNSVQEILAADVIEHLPDKIHTMNEMWRVLANGYRAEIVVPTTDGPGAFQDPTHVSFWNRNSFKYFEKGNPYRERFARAYGITAAFEILNERIIPTMDGPKLQLMLGAIK